MNEFVQNLVDLGEVDSQSQTLREQLALYPKMLADLDRREETAKGKLQQAKQDSDKAREAARNAERDVEVLREQINKYLMQQSSVKTNKEYVALNGEIDTVKAKIDNLDQKGLEALENEESAEEAIGVAEKALQALQEELAEERRRIQGQIDEKQRFLKEGESEHQRRAEALDEETREIYELINEKYPGDALAQVSAGSCAGCGMKLVTQLVLEARRGETIARCGFCQRILHDPAGLAASNPAGD